MEEVRLDVAHDSVDDYIAYRASFGRMSFLPPESHETWLQLIREEAAHYTDAAGRVRLDWVILVLSGVVH